jgi:glutamate-1-semialdehyde 2,1-aminomutase
LEIIMKTIAIIQARMNSTRFPNKVMQPIIDDIPMIEILLSRLSQSREINQIVVATSTEVCNKPLVDHVSSLGYKVYQGSENDVLDRYYQVAIQQKPGAIVRITGDCPLVDPKLVDSIIQVYKSTDADYVSNINPPTYPDGLDIEVFSFSAINAAWKEAKTPFDREHVTSYIRRSEKLKIENVTNSKNYSDERWTVDQLEDYEVIKSIFKYFSPRIDFDWNEVLEFRYLQPSIFSINQHIQRNEGATEGAEQKLWKRAKRIIPGGNMLLSKRPEMFLPNKWPTYYSKAKGCNIWDINDKKYIDMSIMGVGTNILGYSHPEVDEVVINTVKSSNMSSLNCPEEVYLAEKLVELHPWADMARFARSGGEANAIAIRIARAASGKDKVAICGYHGWHDWYLSANLGNDSSLDGHLLPGLDPKGVPRNLKDTVFPFSYNNFIELENLVNNHEIGVIKMEVQRNEPPKDNFLNKVRNLASEKGIVLVFDECTSGFRETFGGLHKKYGVEPDIAVFGKALGNGYAITGIIGRREIMEVAQSTFISSTFWTERIGPTAALKTLEIMEREKSWEQITNTGLEIKKNLQKLADNYKIKISHWGLPSLTGFTINSNHALVYKTLITQEMLAKGYLASNSIYVSTEHTIDVLDGYFNALDPLFQLIKICEEGRDPKELLNGPVCHSGFKRLN